MSADLSFDQAPPISVPFRFFLTAPWFGVAAGLVLLWQGGDLFLSRWTPGALALTHLLVLGFMLQAMTGAVFQFVPVAAGGNVRRASLVAAIIHPTFTAGTLLLCAGFLFAWPHCLVAAAVLMASAGALFVGTTGRALFTTPAVGATVAAMRSAVIALAITIGLGAMLAAGLTTRIVEVTQVHVAWGLGGWALLLLAGVAITVVPMFQLTPAYPVRASRVFPWVAIGALLLWSGRLGAYGGAVVSAGLFLLLALAAAFIVTTLHLQARRRRKIEDANVLMMRSAMVIGLAATVLCGWIVSGLPGSDDQRLEIAAGVLLVAPFVFAINGMLYKIVPFLNWLHLQRHGAQNAVPPSMSRMIPAKAMERQARAQLFTFALLLAASQWPGLARAAGVALVVSFGWLGGNLIGAVTTYRRFKGQVQAVRADVDS